MSDLSFYITVDRNVLSENSRQIYFQINVNGSGVNVGYNYHLNINAYYKENLAGKNKKSNIRFGL
jgi:hypothetical protein